MGGLSDIGINDMMIINSQAFNAKGKDARRIYIKLDSFRSRKTINIIAKTSPIAIIDEPQSGEEEKTTEKCIFCGICQNICPQNCIEMKPVKL